MTMKKDVDLKLLGTCPDTVLAQKWDTSRQHVGYLRRKQGIPVYNRGARRDGAARYRISAYVNGKKTFSLEGEIPANKTSAGAVYFPDESTAQGLLLDRAAAVAALRAGMRAVSAPKKSS
jgi:hypothetical protein